MAIDAAIRQVHREFKYVVDEREAASIERGVEREIPLRPRFAGERTTFVRSVYLDYSNRSLTTGALAIPEDSTKVRYKRYEDPSHRSRTVDASVWLEVKVRRGDLVSKERVPYPGVLLGELLNGHRPPPEAEKLRELLARGRLHPVAGVKYRRVAFEEPDESTRITIDREITFQAPTTPGTTAVDVGRLDFCIVEIKPLREIPEWFETLMNRRAPSAVSKFECAARALGLA
jgi:hypothetical protein